MTLLRDPMLIYSWGGIIRMRFLDKIFDSFNSNKISGLTDELKVQYINYLSNKLNKDIILVTGSLYEATKFYNKMGIYNNYSYFFPMDDFLSSVLTASSPDLEVKRLETLSHIFDKDKKIIVTNLYGYLKFLPNRKSLEDFDISLKSGNDYDRKALEDKLFSFGYKKASIVTSTGEYSVRGFIIDIFPYNYDKPLRIELFGNTIESIKSFDAETQLSVSTLDEVLIKPFKEIIDEDCSSLVDLIPDSVVVFINEDDIYKINNDLVLQINEYKLSNGINDDKKYMYGFDEIKPSSSYFLSDFDSNDYYKVVSQGIDNFNSNFESLDFYINHRKNDMVTIFALQSKNLIEFIKKNYNINSDDNYIAGNLYLTDFKFNNGFVFDKYIVISENDINGSSYSNSYYNPIKIGRKIKDFNDLHVGDYIVHRSHGVGIYGGVVNLVKNGFSKDFILLKYGDNDKIYIPVEKINSIYKYADSGSEVKINSLNSVSWAKAKRRARDKIRDISSELIKLYSERAKLKSPIFKEDVSEVMFSHDFEYEYTVDQDRCITDVLYDLSSSKPMDRLVCGDVGFGKTEIAFRAIFRTVMNGYQAAYLCPTTILSTQQYKSALKRFKNFPVNIALINRFTSVSDFNKIISDLKEGKIDIIFGTHKLFNKDIEYKNLGLLVVDEEQRFGVTQKEKIKELTKNINVLTLSATPIPRTLKMAMSGLRDLSILDTAPAHRFPIQTYVAADNEFLVKECIYKELARGGQVYYLYNRVEDIENELNRLKLLVPDARISMAHGQMRKDRLEKIVEDFVNHKFDVLVCSTIIETGMDISNANTLIIKNADRFGLSQLYQLRGRVGRTNKIAYAYLLYDNSKILNEVAVKRLNAIKEFTELGSGYKIAMRDLSIRGAGDLLGSEQAGFIDSVGIELFTKMVEEAITELNGNVTLEDTSNRALLDVNTHIDEAYVSDESVRIEIHQLINSISDKDSMMRIRSEIEDRFGEVNEDLVIYMFEEWFEKLALKLEINKVVQNNNYVEIEIPMHISDKVNGEKLFMVVYNISNKFSLKYVNKKILIKLNLIGLDKHYIYYLVPLLEEIIHEVE